MGSMDALVVAPKNATLVDLERDCSYLFMPTLQHCSLLDYRNTLFWTDYWLHSHSLIELAPAFVAMVLRRRFNQRAAVQSSRRPKLDHGPQQQRHVAVGCRGGGGAPAGVGIAQVVLPDVPPTVLP
jgi:hypothetical protein